MIRSISIMLIIGSISLIKLQLCESQPTSTQQQVPIKSRGYAPPAPTPAIPPDVEQVQADRRSQYEVLDSEDRSLLDKFYRETARHEDPFQEMWNGSHDKELAGALVDSGGGSSSSKIWQAEKDKQVAGPTRHSDWTIDHKLLEQSKHLNKGDNIEQQIVEPDQHRPLAKYAPTVRLLTVYNPIEKAVREASETNQERGTRGNRVVGATLVGNSQNQDLAKMNISSTSPTEAIKLHDELLEEPPKDGKVRVRMYFHRAIHDDPKLYGTGPWKYWGHGWGVEFGYDPKQAAEGKDNYREKGYTIERAFGRDFCRDKHNCRPPEDKRFY